MPAKIFSAGQKYRVKQDFENRYPRADSKFIHGEIVIFESEGFIPYDDSYGFRFRSEDGTQKFWIIRFDAVDTWQDLFEVA